jgi:hypothetical protein
MTARMTNTITADGTGGGKLLRSKNHVRELVRNPQAAKKVEIFSALNPLKLGDEIFRLLNVFFNVLEECNRFPAIHNTVIITEGYVHHGSNNDFIIDHHWPLFNFVHAKNAALRHIQNRGAQE